ncbi:MAG: sigma-70 family RNA polymerase sigma factor [Pseudomonadota bacterium]
MAEKNEQEEAACLMALIARGERQALVSLMTLYQRPMVSVATRYLGRQDEAEEVVQDVFVRVWQNARLYDEKRAKVTTWIYRINVNLCIDRKRKRAFRQFIGLEEMTTEISDPVPNAADHHESRARLNEVRAAIDKLPDRQRMVLLLSAVAELETAAIADAMRISRGAVEQLLVRARRSLKAMTAEDI